jgi:hypothetical protein
MEQRMSSPARIDILALIISLVAIVISGWAVRAAYAPPMTKRRMELRDTQISAIAKSELASNRAQCFLRMSGKDTTELRRLHLLLQERNRRIADSLPQLQTMSVMELEKAKSSARETLDGAVQVEQQVALTKLSMSPRQLELAKLACPGEG